MFVFMGVESVSSFFLVEGHFGPRSAKVSSSGVEIIDEHAGGALGSAKAVLQDALQLLLLEGVPNRFQFFGVKTDTHLGVAQTDSNGPPVAEDDDGADAYDQHEEDELDGEAEGLLGVEDFFAQLGH